MILAWLLYVLLVGALVTAAAAALAVACRRTGLPQRWVWLAALGVSAVLPFNALRPPAEAPVLAGSPVAAVAADVSSALLPDRSASWISWDLAVVLTWVLASGVVLVVLALVQRRLRLAVRSGTEAVLDGTHVRVTRDLGPAVIGFLRPEIVLPAWTSDLPSSERRLVVQHERAHRDAGDQWLLGLGLAAVVVMPWNAFVWWQLRRLRQAIEIDCDRRLVRAGASPAAYCSLLLDLAERPGASHAPVTALATPVSFLARRLAMLTERQPRTRILRAALGATAGLALLALACQDSLVPSTGVATLPSTVAVAEADSSPVIAPVRLSWPPLRYPALLRDAGIEGDVLVEFVVDTTGRVDSASVEVIESSNRAFEYPATELIRRSTFRAASVDGGKVRLKIRLPVRFRIGAPGDSAAPRPPADGITVVARRPVHMSGMLPPERISGPDAQYPSLLREAGIEGEVVVRFTMNEDGSVQPQSLRVVESSNRAFEAPAVEALRNSRFRPATRDGNPVATTTILTVAFRASRIKGVVGSVAKTISPPQEEH